MYSLESIVFLGFPFILAIVALVALQQMRRQPDPYLIGLLLIFLAEYSSSAMMIFLPCFSVYTVVLLLIIVEAGYLLVGDKMDKRAVNLHHLGTALIVLGHVSLIEWGWTFPVAGFGLFCCGFIVILVARLHKTSSGADSISYLEASQGTPS